MKEKLFIFAGIIFLVVVLVALNAASYVQQEKVPDSETNPNRSTYNVGATGTRAFYDLLAETGRRVVRWQEKPSALLSSGKTKPDTFVVVGSLKREFEDEEIKHLLEWVTAGGKLVIIDREPNEELIKTTANWSISAESDDVPFGGVNPADQKQMTDRVNAAKPIQPTVYTVNINAVQPSRFASAINFAQFADVQPVARATTIPAPMPTFAPGQKEKYDSPAKDFSTPQKSNSSAKAKENKGTDNETISAAPKADSEQLSDDSIETPALIAPVVHLSDDKKNLLVDFPFGSGRIVFLSDPYIISNNGLGLVDNAQLAINVVASTKGIIAFDEYHQGYGANSNQLLAYFAGTPFLAITLQIGVLIGLIFYSQSRRFARALPEKEPSRLSKLEYVAAMAELQQRTKAFDLAIENIYKDFRRRAARLLGVDNLTATYKELASLIAERAKLDLIETENVMFKCEEIMHGERTNKKEVLSVITRLREIEEKLGLKRQKRRSKADSE